MPPGPVDPSPRQIRIVARRNPNRELLAASSQFIFVRRGAGGIFRKYYFFFARQTHFALVQIHESGPHVWKRILLRLSQASEERGIAPKVALLPLVERMIVAFGTLNLQSEEDAGSAGR